ncbi:MAG: hypothetical protein KAH14_00540 [Clostridiales bacterium]|nr:hypothetical protein [Clostridiales bacterium]
MGEGKFNHGLENAGTTIGQAFDTGKYNANYTRKKGMRFFLVMVIIFAIASIIFFTIKTYPIIQILYLDDNEIIVHEIKTNTFGKSRISDEIIIEYDIETPEYRNLIGKAAQAAKIISEYRPEIIAVDGLTLFQLTDEMLISDIKWYVSHQFEEKWLIADAVAIGAISDIVCGVQINEGRYYPWLTTTGYVGVVKNSEKAKNDELKNLMIRELIMKIIAGEPYKVGRRTSGSRLLD